MSRVRQYAKLGTETLLCGSGVAALARRRRAHDTVVLAYHNVVPDGMSVHGERSLHLPQRAFARQLDLLRRTHDVIPLEALLEALPEAPPDVTRVRARPRVVITFDDAYQGALTAGVEELARRRMPATVFVAPAFVGGRSFWWDALGGAFRNSALHALGGRDADVRARALEAGLEPRNLPEFMTCATEAQLTSAASEGITFGSHTWSHPYLPALKGSELSYELEAPRTWLTARFRNYVDWLAYPYGGVSDAVAEASRAAGYDGALRIDGGWCRSAPSFNRHLVPRQNIAAGLSLNGFELRVSGIITGR